MILATNSPLTILVVLSKSILSSELRFFRTSFTIIVNMAFDIFLALLFLSHIKVRFGVVGKGIKCSRFREVTMWSYIPWIFGQKNRQCDATSLIFFFSYNRQYSQLLDVTQLWGYLLNWSLNCVFLYNNRWCLSTISWESSEFFSQFSFLFTSTCVIVLSFSAFPHWVDCSLTLCCLKTYL